MVRHAGAKADETKKEGYKLYQLYFILLAYFFSIFSILSHDNVNILFSRKDMIIRASNPWILRITFIPNIER